MKEFAEYLRRTYGPVSGTANSYKMAIKILDRLIELGKMSVNTFDQNDVLNFSGNSIVSITDLAILNSIYDEVKDEEKKMRAGVDSIFEYGKSSQQSYPKKGFCSAAVRSLIKYRESIIDQQAASCAKAADSTSQLLKDLKKITKISNTESNAEVHQRIGQNIFRSVLLEIYRGQCCVCGLNITELLRASHILPWAENKQNRLNPENGLCLSATYDAAFDKYLISFDDDYRMIVSPYIQEFYTNNAANEYFKRFEGKQLTLPYKFSPNKEFLNKHREKLIGL